MKRALIAGMLLSAVSAVAVTATASAGERTTETVYAPKDCTKPRVEPKQITIACADDGIFPNKKPRGARDLRSEKLFCNS